jgi:hypothetical protein
MLRATGKYGASATGASREKPDRRSIVRQHEAAGAIAHAGFSIELDPKVLTADISSGISQNASPDYRIEGILFDCYSPEPPLVAEEQARLEVFHEYQVGGESDYERDWEKEHVDRTRPGVRFEHLIAQRVHADVADKIRSAIREKVPRQCLGVVLNLSDVLSFIGAKDIWQVAFGRATRGELQYIIVIVPGEHTAQKTPKLESVEPGQFLKLGGNAVTPYRPQFEYGHYSPSELNVIVLGSRAGGATGL